MHAANAYFRIRIGTVTEIRRPAGGTHAEHPRESGTLDHSFLARDHHRGQRQRVASRLLKVTTALAITALLAGCALAPGQNLRSDNDSVNVIPITPQLVTADQARPKIAGTAAQLLGQPQHPYHIGAGDSLYITVWDHPELTSPAGSQQQTSANGRLVKPDGTLFYPFIGDFQVAGMTIGEARRAITKGLAPFINKPQVDLAVIGYNSQHVIMGGAFTKPGPQPITDVPLTLAEAVGVAGVNTAEANLSDVVISRGDRDYHLNLDRNAGLAGKIYLEPGDSVLLPYNDRQEVYVLGEVTRPMAIRFKTTDLTLTQALGQAGGLSQTTSRGTVYVIRRNRGQARQYATVYELDASSPAAFALADDFSVVPGDVVFASAAGITRWNRFLSQVLPSTSALSAAAATDYYIKRN